MKLNEDLANLLFNYGFSALPLCEWTFQLFGKVNKESRAKESRAKESKSNTIKFRPMTNKIKLKAGIILKDDRILSFPSIQLTSTKPGIITYGKLSKEELEFILDVGIYNSDIQLVDLYVYTGSIININYINIKVF